MLRGLQGGKETAGGSENQMAGFVRKYKKWNIQNTKIPSEMEVALPP